METSIYIHDEVIDYQDLMESVSGITNEIKLERLKIINIPKSVKIVNIRSSYPEVLNRLVQFLLNKLVYKIFGIMGVWNILELFNSNVVAVIGITADTRSLIMKDCNLFGGDSYLSRKTK